MEDNSSLQTRDSEVESNDKINENELVNTEEEMDSVNTEEEMDTNKTECIIECSLCDFTTIEEEYLNVHLQIMHKDLQNIKYEKQETTKIKCEKQGESPTVVKKEPIKSRIKEEAEDLGNLVDSKQIKVEQDGVPKN